MAEWTTIEGTQKVLPGRGEHTSELQTSGDEYMTVFKSSDGLVLLKGTPTKCRITANLENCNMRLAYMLNW
jgi:hypothetical protein